MEILENKEHVAGLMIKAMGLQWQKTDSFALYPIESSNHRIRASIFCLRDRRDRCSPIDNPLSAGLHITNTRLLNALIAHHLSPVLSDTIANVICR